MLKIKWIGRITNDEFFSKVQKRKIISKILKIRRHS